MGGITNIAEMVNRPSVDLCEQLEAVWLPARRVEPRMMKITHNVALNFQRPRQTPKLRKQHGKEQLTVRYYITDIIVKAPFYGFDIRYSSLETHHSSFPIVLSHPVQVFSAFNPLYPV